MDLGTSIKTIRKERKISQKELAQKCGISVNALSQIETNISFPHKNTILNIANTLDVPISYLLYFSITEEDISKEKRELYNIINPTMKSILIDSMNSKTTD